MFLHSDEEFLDEVVAWILLAALLARLALGGRLVLRVLLLAAHSLLAFLLCRLQHLNSSKGNNA